MVANKIAENVMGTLGTICWSIQIAPQIWKSYREGSTDGLSDWLVFLWATSGPFLGVYVIIQNLNIPLILQPHILSVLCAVSWAQCLFYGRKWPLGRCILCCVVFIVLMAGFEVGMIYAVRPSAREGDTTPLRFFSIASSVAIALGIMPQYWEIYKRGEVVGLSMLFMAVDISGGLFSILSLTFKEKFDVFASFTYVVIVTMDIPVVIAALVLNPTAKRKRGFEQMQSTETLTISPSGAEDSKAPKRSELESGNGPAAGGSIGRFFGPRHSFLT